MGEPQTFRRGDANTDGTTNIGDAIYVLGYVFGLGESLRCEDAADANNDERVQIADAIAILGMLFANRGPLPAPFKECGMDPPNAEANLDCQIFAPCWAK